MKKQAVMVYIENDNDEILFLIRNKQNDLTHIQGMYLPIGGKVEPGELIEECAIREVREESSLIVSDLKLKAVLHFVGWGEEKHDWVDFVFTTSKFKGKPKTGNEGSFEWVKKTDFDKINLYEGDKIFLPLIYSKDFSVIEYRYNKFNLISHKVLI